MAKKIRATEEDDKCRKVDESSGGKLSSEQGELTVDQMRQLLRDLRDKQVELETQNRELRLTRDNLRQSEEKYRAMIDAFDGYMYVCSQGFRIEFMNEKMIRRTGRDATGEYCHNALHDLDSPCEWCVNGQVFNGSSVRWEVKSPKDERWYEINNTPIFNADGSISKLAMISDITARILFEDTLKARELETLRIGSAYTRSLIEASLDPLVTINPAGKITDVNEASVRVTGIPREQLIGTDFIDYFTDPEKARKGYLKVFSNGVVHDYPLAIRHVSGEITEVLYNASIYKDEHGEVQGVFAAARDVTALNRAIENLKEVHDELESRVFERTAALMAAHEQMKKVSFELVWAEEKERERIAQELHDQVGQSLLLAKLKLDALVENISSDQIRANAEQAISLLSRSIQDIRTLTFRIRPPILDTSGIETALEWLCLSIRNDYGLKIDFINDCHSLHLSDEMRYALYHAVRELLLNVAKHAGTDRAQLSIKSDGHNLTVSVSDHGVGFKNPDAQHIKNGGYGLYNVQQRTELMGGRFAIESAAGIGTSVTLLFPM